TAYHSGASDEAVPATVVEHKKSVRAVEYPPLQEAYAGPVTDTWRASELAAGAMDPHVTVYHTGYYEHLPVTLARKKTHPEGYPVPAERYERPLSEVSKRQEATGHPLESHVAAYHAGHYTHLEPVHEEGSVKGEKSGLFGRLGSLFKR